MKRFLSTTAFLLLVFLLSATLALSGCSQAPEGSVEVSTPSPEELMLENMGDDDLLAVMESEMIISSGEQKPNKLAIKNAYEEPQTFNIEICEFCSFDKETVELPAGSVEIVDFAVRKPSGESSGERTIVVRDDLNNFYAKESFTVTG